MGFDTPYYTGFPKKKPFSFQYCIIHQKTNDVAPKHGYIMAEEGKLPAFRRILTYPQTQIVCYKCKYQRNYNQLINNGSDAPRLHQKMGIVQAIEAIDDNGRVTQLRLFPEERAPESDDGSIVRIQMNQLSVRNMRNWGEVWLGLQLWDMLELDNFWSGRIDKSRKGTDWLALLKAIVVYRLTAPGSELQMHERWLARLSTFE